MKRNFVLILLSFLIAAGSSACSKKFPPKDRQFLVSQGAMAFREKSLTDIQAALDQFASPQAAAKFKQFDERIWRLADPGSGWSYFLNTSVIAVGNQQSDHPVVAFYHPWSDVFLLTEWEVDEKGPRILDAEMLMGDFVRNRGGPPLKPSALWIRARTFKPVAVGVEAGLSVRAFEKLFPAKGGGNWRGHIPYLDDKEIVEGVNYSGVSVLLAQNLADIVEFRKAEPGEDETLSSIRNQTEKVLKSAQAGKLGPVLKAAHRTLPATRKVLAGLPAEQFGLYEPVSFLLGSDASIVFLVSPQNADYFLSCVFEGKGSKQKLTRLDLVSYGSMYEATPEVLKQIAGNAS